MRLLKLLGQALGTSQVTERGPRPEKQAKPAVSSPPMCRDPRANRLLGQGGYCNLLKDSCEWQSDAIWAARKLLESEMAFVPAGGVNLRNIAIEGNSTRGGARWLREDSFFVDRYTVTNAQFKRFLEADGYRTKSLWPVAIQQLVPRFIDSTGVPGPANWIGGNYDAQKSDHPVVGVSWLEARAYANWIGKRLPTSSQWQRAGTWWSPGALFPWGDRFQRRRLNTLGDSGDIAAVGDYESSATPYGVAQLVGNVWEWVDNCFTEIECDGQLIELNEPVGEIRGGAFDTYFPSQATCDFRSAQPLLSRTDNVGFRCVANSHLLAVTTKD